MHGLQAVGQAWLPSDQPQLSDSGVLKLRLKPLNFMSGAEHCCTILLCIAAWTRVKFCKKIVHGQFLPNATLVSFNTVKSWPLATQLPRLGCVRQPDRLCPAHPNALHNAHSSKSCLLLQRHGLVYGTHNGRNEEPWRELRTRSCRMCHRPPRLRDLEGLVVVVSAHIPDHGHLARSKFLDAVSMN